MSRHHARLDWRRWRGVRLVVFHRDGYRCVKCGWPGWLECDHIVPLEDDPDQDPYDPAGCQSLCPPCHCLKTANENRARRNLTPAEREWLNLVDAIRSSP